MRPTLRSELDRVVEETFASLAFAEARPVVVDGVPPAAMVERIPILAPFRGALWIAAPPDAVNQLARWAWGQAADDTPAQHRMFLDELLNVVAGALLASTTDGEVAIGFAEPATSEDWPSGPVVAYEVEGRTLAFHLEGAAGP